MPQLVANIVGNSTFFAFADEESNITAEGSFNVTADFLGYSTLTLTLTDSDGEVRVTEHLPSHCWPVIIGITILSHHRDNCDRVSNCRIWSCDILARNT